MWSLLSWVFPFISSAVARNVNYLKAINVTHVVNCAQGAKFNMVNTDQSYYSDANIGFKGYTLDDICFENISRYFRDAAQYIHDALESNGTNGGRVLIHCLAGISRSAAITIAYLMLFRGLSLVDAARTVRLRRYIRPNEGFLKQLVELDLELSGHLREKPTISV